MKRLSLIFALVLLLAGCAVGPTSTPSYGQGYGGAQGYGGYNYAPPPQNPYANPWVGNNTPWTFYQGDWFANGILHQFFGNQYGWAPYYAYPPTYIVRPQTWYAPQWNAWYQRNPHYWQNFEQKYPYWRGHRVGQRYDENFYNKHHRGQGEGWNQGFHGVRPATPTGPGVRPAQPVGPTGRPATPTGPYIRSTGPTSPGERPGHPTGPVVRPGQPTGPSVRPGQPTGPGVHPGQPAGPTVRPAQPTGPGVRPAQPTGPSVRPAQPASPVVRPAQPTGPGVRPAQPTGPSVRPAQPTGTGGRAPAAPAPGERKPQKPTGGEEKPQ
jgi:hypothetical protein